MTITAGDVAELVEDIDVAADELIDSVKYLQEKLNAGEELYESKWIGGVMSAHEMLLRLSEHIKHADAWPCDGEGDERGNFVCRKDAALTALAGERDELRKALDEARGLIRDLIENDPSDPISDAGHVVLDLWREHARNWLDAYKKDGDK